MSILQSPDLQRLYDDWQARRHGREFPARSDFDILDLAYIVNSLSLIDVFHNPLRFHFRVHGGRIAERIGFDLTGKDLDELPNQEYRESIRRSFMSSIERREPNFVMNGHVLAHQRHYINEVLVLPLSSDGTNIDKLLTGLSWV
jgi:hypothetical protein